MITLMEDLTLAIQELCLAMGLSGTAARILPVVLLGRVMNIVALSALDSLRTNRYHSCQQPALTHIAKAELEFVRIAVASSVKNIGKTRRYLCSTKQWLMNMQDHPPANGVA